MPANADRLRLFVGIGLDKELRRQLAALQEQLEAAKLFRGRFSRVDNLHVTLKFLGELPATAAADLGERLERVAYAPFTAPVTGLGLFGGRRPRVLWLGFGGDELVALQQQVDRCFEGLFALETDYQPHLTLARLKSAPRAEVLQQQLAELPLEPMRLRVESFALVRSVLEAAGPQYTNLATFAAGESRRGETD